MSDDDLNQIWRKLTDEEVLELKELCERMVYYCDHPHFDGFNITLADLHGCLGRLDWMLRPGRPPGQQDEQHEKQ